MCLAYEIAFLRVFCEWEALLADATLRMMMGYESVLYSPTFPAGVSKSNTIADAEHALLEGQPYILCHNLMCK